MPRRGFAPNGRALQQWMGWMLIVPGLLVLPLPIPLGLVMIIAGLALAARYDPLLQGWIRRLRARFPDASRRANRLHRYLPFRLRRVLVSTDPERRRR